MSDHGVRIGDDFKSKSQLDKSSISLLLKQRQLPVAGRARARQEIPIDNKSVIILSLKYRPRHTG
jgi:hypothetical protein